MEGFHFILNSIGTVCVSGRGEGQNRKSTPKILHMYSDMDKFKTDWHIQTSIYIHMYKGENVEKKENKIIIIIISRTERIKLKLL